MINILIAPHTVVHIVFPAITALRPLPTTDEKFLSLIKSTKKSFASNMNTIEFTAIKMMSWCALDVISSHNQSCQNHCIHPQENPSYIPWIYHCKAVPSFNTWKGSGRWFFRGSIFLSEFLVLPPLLSRFHFSFLWKRMINYARNTRGVSTCFTPAPVEYLVEMM